MNKSERKEGALARAGDGQLTMNNGQLRGIEIIIIHSIFTSKFIFTIIVNFTLSTVNCPSLPLGEVSRLGVTERAVHSPSSLHRIFKINDLVYVVYNKPR